MEQERVHGLGKIPRPLSKPGMQALIPLLTEEGLTVKEVAFLLGVTPEKIYRLRSEARRNEQPQEPAIPITAKAG